MYSYTISAYLNVYIINSEVAKFLIIRVLFLYILLVVQDMLIKFYSYFQILTITLLLE